MRTALIFNPTSGISTVTEKRMSPEETEKRYSGRIYVIMESNRNCCIPLLKMAAEAWQNVPQDEGAGLVIAAGGDGTVHAVANGLVGTQSILGIIPSGTMNNVALSLNIPDTIPAACIAIANGKTRTHRCGKDQ